MNIVEVDDAVAGNVIVGGCEFEFGHQSATSARQSRHYNRAYPVCDGVSGEHQYRAVSARGGGKPQFTAPHRPNQPNPPPVPSAQSRR